MYSSTLKQITALQNILSKQEKKKLETLFEMDVVKASVLAEEKEELEKRAKKIKQLKNLKIEMERAEDHFKVADAQTEYENSKKKTDQLFEKFLDLQAKKLSYDTGRSSQLLQIEMDLKKTSDPLIANFLNILDNTRSLVHLKSEISFYTTRNWLTKEPSTAVHSNYEEIKRVLDLINDCVDTSREMQLEAIASEFIEKNINEMCKALSIVLRPFSINIPVIANGAVV